MASMKVILKTYPTILQNNVYMVFDIALNMFSIFMLHWIAFSVIGGQVDSKVYDKTGGRRVRSVNPNIEHHLPETSPDP